MINTGGKNTASGFYHQNMQKKTNLSNKKEGGTGDGIPNLQK